MPSATGGSGGGVGFASDSNFKNIYTRLMYRFNLERDKESRNSVQAAGPTGPRDHTFLSLGGFYLYGDSLQRFKWGAEVRSNELLATFRHVVTSLYGLVGARRVLIGAGVRRSHFRRDCIIASFNCIVLKINALVHASRLGFKGMPIALLVVSSEGSVMHLRFDRQGITVSCRSLIARVGALALLTLPYSGALNAASIVVTGDSSGFFGTPTIGAKLLTQGVVVSSPAEIVVKATGTVFDFNDQGRFLSVTPNGVDFTSIYGDVLPLQEAQGIPGNTPTTILDALMGTFVPAATAMLPTSFQRIRMRSHPARLGSMRPLYFSLEPVRLRSMRPVPVRYTLASTTLLWPTIAVIFL